MSPDRLREGVPEPVRRVCAILREAGHEAFVVGGGVRDLLLGHTHAPDWDVATSAVPNAVLCLFPHAIPTGLQHGTITVVEAGVAVEVTTYRVETAYSDGRRPDTVTFVRKLEDDLARRDFTVNAMALDPFDGSLRDPFGGLLDLRRRWLRAVGGARARFAEDGLRPLRAMRFAATLEFTLDPDLLAAVPETLATFRRVAPERVRAEMEKLLCAPAPSRGLAPMEQSGLLAEVLPELAAAPAPVRDRALRRADAVPREWLLRFAALHAEIDPQGARAALERLRPSKRDLAGLVAVLSLLPRLAALPLRGEEVRRLLAEVSHADVARTLELWRADQCARGASAEAEQHRHEVASLVDQALRDRVPLAISDLALDGDEVCAILGLTPGPEVGRRLRRLLDLVLEDPSRNTRERLRGELARDRGDP